MKHIKNIYPKRPSPCNCLNLRRASRAVSQFYDKVLEPCGISIAQLALLRHVELAEKTTISKLAKLMRIDRTTLNRNMKPLVETGLISICAGKDSRTKQINLTPAGRKTIAQGWELWGEAQTAISGYLGDDELTQLTQLLAKLEALAPD
ncbi:MAG TPA: MarR family winged helix-turn-helix transcriptional regulator [Negativicutes bacterium]|nr:MarR family winged helix-turn-helix transcriptional regulator [Negativicutes bacterium]